MSQFVVPISTVDKSKIDAVGKYAGELGDLHHIEIPIPDGFIITSSSFRQFLLINNLGVASSEKQILHGSMSQDMIREIIKAYRHICGILRESIVILTSSSPLSSLSNLSYEVKGDANLFLKIKAIWASEYVKNDYDNNTSIVVQRKIESKKEGTIFTEDPHSTDETVVHIKHKNMSSHFSVSKKDLDIVFKGHLSKSKNSHRISDSEAIELSLIGKKLEEYFRYPQEIKFVILKNKIYILETKSLLKNIKKPIFYNNFPDFNYKPKINHSVLLRGISNFPGIATGQVRIVSDLKNLKKVLPSQIIVTSIISPDLFSVIKKVGGIIAENNPFAGYSRILYSNMVARPSVFNVKNATKILHNGNVVTLDGGKGEVYKGGL